LLYVAAWQLASVLRSAEEGAAARAVVEAEAVAFTEEEAAVE
jgi:hypothetical protein